MSLEMSCSEPMTAVSTRHWWLSRFKAGGEFFLPLYLTDHLYSTQSSVETVLIQYSPHNILVPHTMLSPLSDSSWIMTFNFKILQDPYLPLFSFI